MFAARIQVPHKTAQLASVLLAGMAAVDLALAWWAIELRAMIDGFSIHELPSGYWDHVQIGETIELFEGVGLVVTGVVFVIWLYRAYGNVPALGYPETNHRPGRAIYGWIIPFANLWLPYRVVATTWRASNYHPEGQLDLDEGVGTVQLWWAGWVCTWLVTRSDWFLPEPDTLDALDDHMVAAIIASLSAAVTAICAIVMVQRLTRRLASRQCAHARLVLD